MAAALAMALQPGGQAANAKQGAGDPVSEGFSNPIIGGGGVLVYPSIHSGNFVTGVSGWTINKDGSAEFSNITARGSVIIKGARGEFTYDAAGNLRSANCGQVTTDPVQGLTCQQGFSTFNGHGAVINLLSTANGAFFQYQDLGSSSQGPLILVVASASGTDPVASTAYGAGMTGIDPVFGDFIVTVGANINLGQVAYTRKAGIAAQVGSGASQPRLQLDAPEQTTASHLQMWMTGESPDASKAAQLILAAVSGAGVLTPQTSALLEVQGTIAAGLLRAIVSGAQETWHTVGAGGQPAFGAGFANGAIGAAPAGFQFEAVGGGRVRLRGAVALTANQVGGATMFTLPAGYRPASTQFFDCTPTSLSGYAKSTGSVVVATSGAVTINCAGTNGNFVGLDGIVIELDN